MTSSDEEEFDHHVDQWTAGQLRAVLADVPDHAPILVIPADEPGGVVAGDEQVVYAAELIDGTVMLSAEYPPGRYYRRRYGR